MGVVDALAPVLFIFLYFFVLFVLSLGVFVVIAGAIGLLGGVLSIPALYVLPDVRRFLVQASGGRPDDGTPAWRVVLRPRYLLLSVVFGVLYGFGVLALFLPVSDLPPFSHRGEPTAWVAILPAVFVVAGAVFAYGVHRRSSAWTGDGPRRSVLIQWIVFLGVVVAVGTGLPLAYLLV